MNKRGKYDIIYDINEKSSLDRHIIDFGVLDMYVLQNPEQFICDGLLLDVGANVGYFSLVFAKFGMKCFAFEPIPYIYQRLLNNINLNNLDIECFQFALSDSNEFVNISVCEAHDNEGFVNDGISKIGNFDLHRKDNIIVETKTIDSLNLDNVGFIKIDTEGHDFNVILGGLSTIKKYKPTVMYEHSKVLDGIVGNLCAKNCYNIMNELGYNQFFISDMKKLNGFEYREYDDVICIKD